MYQEEVYVNQGRVHERATSIITVSAAANTDNFIYSTTEIKTEIFCSYNKFSYIMVSTIRIDILTKSLVWLTHTR